MIKFHQQVEVRALTSHDKCMHLSPIKDDILPKIKKNSFMHLDNRDDARQMSLLVCGYKILK